MAITDILLRTVSHADLTTKNAVITWEEEDQNFIEIYEALKSLQNVDVSLFEPYNAGTTYESGDYVSYDGNIYRFINVTPTSGITPGTDPLYWELASVGEFAHQQNYDQYLDFGGPNQVSAADLYALLNGGTSDFFENGGNSFGATAQIGTTDANQLEFITGVGGVSRGAIGATGKWMMGVTSPFADTYFSFQSQGATSATYAAIFKNSTPTTIAWLKDDGSAAFRKSNFTIGEVSAEASVVITDAAPVFLTAPNRSLKFTANTVGVGAAELTFECDIINFPGLITAFSSTEGIVKLPSQTGLNFYGLGASVKGAITLQNNDLWLYGFNVFGDIGYEDAEWAKVIIETSKGLVFGEPSVGADVGSGARVISIKNAVTEPTAAKTDGSLLWASSQVLKTNARFNIVKTTEQLRVGYDSTNYMSATVGSTGSTTIDLTGTSPIFTFGKLVVASGFRTDTTVAVSNFNAGAGGAATAVSSSSGLTFGGAAQVRFRASSRGTTSTTATANDSYASWIFGEQGFTEASSGTHALACQAVFKAITITAGAASTTDSATVYIEGAATGATNNYAFWVDSGVSRFDGNLSITDVDFVFGTTTGTKIGTATTQKIGLWNATPIVQPTTAVAAATFVANTSAIANDTATFDGYTIGQVVKALRNIGILA